MKGGRYETMPVAWSLPPIEGEVFSTGTGDAAFLAALKRERVGMHADFVHAPARRRTALDRVAQPLPANGTCPNCGTRLAFGCKHHPLEGGTA